MFCEKTVKIGFGENWFFRTTTRGTRKYLWKFNEITLLTGY